MNRFKIISNAILLLGLTASMQGMENMPFNFAGLPKDMQNEILIKYVNSAIQDLSQEIEEIRQTEEAEYLRELENPDFDWYEIAKRNQERRSKITAEALKKINNLIMTNKDFSAKMNEPRFTYKLIVDLAEKLDTYDEIIAKALGTKAAQDRIQLQNDFVHEMTAIGVQFSQRKFEDFIKKGVDLEWTDEFGWTPLFQTVSTNKLAATKALIKAGVNVNYSNHDRMTALSLTVRPRYQEHEKFPISQRVEMIKFLIASGADVFGAEELQRIKDPVHSANLKKEVVDAIEQAQLNLRNYVRYVQPRPRKRVVNLNFIQ